MPKRKKILYLMHVSWGWIKQRPHFFAELLAKDHDVDVFFRAPTFKSESTKVTSIPSDISALSINSFTEIPFRRIPILKHLKLEWINSLLLKKKIKDIKKYDVVWICNPYYYSYIKPYLSKDCKVVYDCMDDFLEFPIYSSSDFLRNSILTAETKLLKEADVVFCSADHLKNKIAQRSNLNREIIILNNAIEPPAEKAQSALPEEIVKQMEKMPFVITYIGTVSEWMDFDSIIKMLDEIKEAHAVIFGPVKTNVPQHERMHFMGSINRDCIFEAMNKSDMLMMPFIVNELIESVNPVKLYEYIFSGKPVVASDYGEIRQFKKHIQTYTTPDEFVFAVKNAMAREENDSEKIQSMKEFALNNTWQKRYDRIKEALI